MRSKNKKMFGNERKLQSKEEKTSLTRSKAHTQGRNKHQAAKLKTRKLETRN